MTQILKVFSYNYCRALADEMWKKRVSWTRAQAAAVKPGSIVLDIGAGISFYKNDFAHCTYVAHDFARLKETKYQSLDVISDINNIPLPDEFADVIICTEVFEHIPYPLLALKEINRLLKTNGLLILTAPLGSGQHQKPYHFYGGYTRFFYEKFLPDNGFNITSLEANGGIYGHMIEKLWRTNEDLNKHREKGFFGKVYARILQTFIYNIPTLYFDKMEKIKQDEDFTVGFLVTAKKISKSI